MRLRLRRRARSLEAQNVRLEVGNLRARLGQQSFQNFADADHAQNARFDRRLIFWIHAFRRDDGDVTQAIVRHALHRRQNRIFGRHRHEL